MHKEMRLAAWLVAPPVLGNPSVLVFRELVAPIPHLTVRRHNFDHEVGRAIHVRSSLAYLMFAREQQAVGRSATWSVRQPHQDALHDQSHVTSRDMLPHQTKQQQ